ncbi:MAG: hypothetical protein WEB06_17360 [Actinomycetota bacterium]
MPELDRRTFLAVSGLAFVGLATSCGGDDEPSPTGGTIESLISQAEAERATRIQVIQANLQVLVRSDARVPFALISSEGARSSGGSPRAWYGQAGTRARGPVEVSYHGEGLGEKGVYVGRFNFDQAGQWQVFVTANDGGRKLYGEATFEAVQRVSGPAPGAKAIAVPTPTVDDHRGVEPYCTRVDSKGEASPCSMHRISLDVALANGKPTVLNIGTPKFCTSRVCGPVVDVIQTVGAELADRVNFVHVEVYKDDKADTVQRQLLAPAAAAWGLSEEPITYWIKPDGTITERVVGPIDVPEVRDLTNALLS